MSVQSPYNHEHEDYKPHMNLQKILWTTLTGTIILIVSLLSSWGRSVESRLGTQQVLVQSLLESKSAHDQELKDIHQDLLRIEKLLEQR